MSVAQLAAQVLLWSGVAIEVVACVGVWWMHDVFDRLHFTSVGSGLGPLLIAVAVALSGAGSASATVEAASVGVVLALVGPMVTHATGRAARRLRYGDLGPDPEELGEDR